MTALSPGQFVTISFPLAAGLQQTLANGATDLRIKLVVNAPALTQPYLIDHLVLTEGQGGSAGGSATQFIEPDTVYIPREHSITEVLFAGSDEIVRIGDRVELHSALGGSVAVTSSRAGGVNVGVDARTGHIVSEGTVTLRNHSTVQGDVTTASFIEAQFGAVVLGQSEELASPEYTPLAVSVDFSAPATQSVVLAPEESRTLLSGRYSRVVVERDGELTLVPGTYRIDDLVVNAEGTLVISHLGTVIVAVQEELVMHGRVQGLASSTPNWLLTYTGTQFVSLEQPFRGTVLAPNAVVELGSTNQSHIGSFFARGIEARPGSLIVQQPFRDWELACAGHRSATGFADRTAAVPGLGVGLRGPRR